MAFFPFGEWFILFITLETWVEKRASRLFFLSLTTAWLLGKGLEVIFPSTPTWHWHFARLSVMLVFWVWGVTRAERRVLPLILSSLVVGLETLFQVNEPGVFPSGTWIFLLILTIVAWLSAKSFWGTAAALTGSLLLNQAFVRFTYDGIVRYADFPDEVVWNFGVTFFVFWASLRLGWQVLSDRKLEKSTSETFATHSACVCEPREERELQ